MFPLDTDQEIREKDQEPGRCSYLNEKVLPYSNNVLIGNWMQSRYESVVTKNNAILPGMMVEDSCETHQTASQATYTAAPFDLRKATAAHFDIKGQVMAIKLAQGSNVILHDSDQFLSNYTTMNTLMFDLWPKMRRDECLQRQKLGQMIYKRARYNALDTYGNYSLVKNRKYRMNPKPITKLFDHVTTSYQRDYPPKISEQHKRKSMEKTANTKEWAQLEAEKELIINCQFYEDLKNTTGVSEPCDKIPTHKFEW
ncbi:uncharacterized protein LOC111519035 [Drosophila willistoni]|uniref:GK20389 n=1 Tax=Drosophila willistoni TaxID=7260 RepID=B4N541_DROWI|nr:uncharacterized protein LOC111519035 [Drosophila willistoni]